MQKEAAQRDTYTLPEVYGQLRYLNTQLQEIQCEAEAIANLHPTTRIETKPQLDDTEPTPEPTLMKKIDNQLQEAHQTTEQTFTTITNINKWLQPEPTTTASTN